MRLAEWVVPSQRPPYMIPAYGAGWRRSNPNFLSGVYALVDAEGLADAEFEGGAFEARK